LNLKENRTGDLYLTMVESKKHGETDFERHQVVVFEEDFDALHTGMEKVFGYIREQRMAGRKRPRGAGKSGDE